MSFLLMVFLAVVCMLPAYPPPPWGGPPWLAAALTAGNIALVAGFAWMISRRVGGPLASDPTLLDLLLHRYERWRQWHGVASTVLFAASLWLLGWGWCVRSLYGGKPGHGSEVLLLLPYFVGQALSWAFFYDADRAAHVASHRLHELAAFAPGLEARQAVPAFGGRWRYVTFQLRQKLALAFVPVLLLVLHQEATRLLPESMAKAPATSLTVSGAGLAMVLVGLPLLVRFVLGLKPLDAGPLRSRLLATARRLNVKLSDVLVWNTRGGMANAMIIGLVPWVRYVVFTDRMLEEFSHEEIQAVFGHELGHAKHQHMLFYLGFLSVSLLVLVLLASHYMVPALVEVGNHLSARFPGVLPESLGAIFDGESDWAIIPVLVVLLMYIFVVFGLLSRQCERQADVFGCRAVSCGEPGCRAHGEATEYRAEPRPCEAGVNVFIRALERVALLNGIDREKPGFLQSWQHGSISRRVAFLRGMAACDPVEKEFQRGTWRLKWGVVAGLCAALVWLLATHGMK